MTSIGIVSEKERLWHRHRKRKVLASSPNTKSLGIDNEMKFCIIPGKWNKSRHLWWKLKSQHRHWKRKVSTSSPKMKSLNVVAGNEKMKQVSALLTETKSIGIVAENEKSRHRRWKRKISQVAREMNKQVTREIPRYVLSSPKWKIERDGFVRLFIQWRESDER